MNLGIHLIILRRIMNMGMYKKIFEDYVKNNKNEEDLNIICNQLDNKSDRNLIDRKNFIGHFTASCFVVSKKNK